VSSLDTDLLWETVAAQIFLNMKNVIEITTTIRPFQLKHAMDLNNGPSVLFGSLELLINDWKCGMGD
jgi:hypothetical protein